MSDQCYSGTIVNGFSDVNDYSNMLENRRVLLLAQSKTTFYSSHNNVYYHDNAQLILVFRHHGQHYDLSAQICMEAIISSAVNCAEA